jgi:N-acetylglucosamine-6-sulfatase
MWDTDEFFDLQSDPDESRNLIHDPAFEKQAKEMENKLYQMMGGLGGMEIPLNPPSGSSNRIRLRERGGEHASDFPPPFVVDEPVNTNAD